MTARSLAGTLREARQGMGLSLRDVERRTGIRNSHLSQLETGTIARPEMSLLWDLSVLYDLDFGALLGLAGYGEPAMRSAEGRQRMTVALRVLGELSPADQEDALNYMAELKRRSEADA